MKKANPFKKISENANTTAKKWQDERPDSVVESEQCPCCGAPRPVNTNIAYCSYCGYNFMSVDVNIKRNHE